MDKAIHEITRFRDTVKRCMEGDKLKIESLYEQIGILEKEIKKAEQLIEEYNKVLEMVEDQ